MAKVEPHRLVIVESPTKAVSLSKFLGPGYIVESSRGHVRDLPTTAAEIPAKFKGEKWARTGVNVDDGFMPVYVVPAGKKATLRDLKAKLKDVDELFLATDEDREGEAIAWHLLDELKP
ncbi:MAG: DNA topoisomerase I, partial [Propionibacteriaceae bacterium]|nr:DNA topoisomerase I [Propionibacteriaceae bacterium]